MPDTEPTLIDPFTNIPVTDSSIADQGAIFLSDLRSLNVGDGGNNVFRVDKDGLFLGGKTFAAAPFKVTMAGIMTAVGAVLGDYITVGGAAADVNAGITTISGGKITTNSLAASAIITGQLVVGTNVGLGTAQDAAGVTTIIDDTITTGYINALEITVLGAVTAGSLTGVTITGGTIRTSTSGARIVISGATDDITIYDSSQKVGTIFGSASSLWLQANVAGGNVSFANGATVLATIDQDGNMALLPAGAAFAVPSGGMFGWLDYNYAFSASAGGVSLNTDFDVDGDITGYTCVVSGSGTGLSSALKAENICTTDGRIYYNGDLIFDMYASNVRANKHLYPESDNSLTCGGTSYRWSDLRTVLINGADYGFEHQWYLTESYKVGIEEEGIAVLNQKNELRVFIGETGIYVPGGVVKNLDLLPYVKTTIEERSLMDRYPEKRNRSSDVKALEIPRSADAGVGGRAYKRREVVLKATKPEKK